MSKCKYITRLYDVKNTENNLYIFLELCKDGDLKSYLKKRVINKS